MPPITTITSTSIWIEKLSAVSGPT